MPFFSVFVSKRIGDTRRGRSSRCTGSGDVELRRPRAARGTALHARGSGLRAWSAITGKGVGGPTRKNYGR